MKALDYQSIKRIIQKTTQPAIEIFIFLDRPQNEMNIAHIFRLADASNLCHIYLFKPNTKINWRKIEKLSRKNSRHIPYSIPTNLDIIEKYNHIYALEWTDNSQDIFSLSTIPSKLILILGNEKNGIHKDILNMCTKSIHIPMYGLHSSMNMAMAGAITVYQLIALSIKQ